MTNYEHIPFEDFKVAIQKHWNKMAKNEHLFRVKVDKDDLWNTYLDSFPEGTNLLYKERREYDCNCCKQFIRAIGDTICISDGGGITTIWDVQVGGYYQVVADKMSAFIKTLPVDNVFTHFEKVAGTDHNHQLIQEEGKEPSVKKWEHFFAKIPSKFVNKEPGSYLSTTRSNKEVLFRSLFEITLDSAETVLELIDQNSLYRGQEHKSTVELFIKLKKEFDKISPGEDFFWLTSAKIGGAGKIRNTVIGTLMSDLSEGVDINTAVASFESKVAPHNYKRPSAVVTKAMIQKLQKEVEDKGLEQTLYRRYAKVSDITVNNVIFADRSAKKAMSGLDTLFEEMLEESSTINMKELDRVEEVGVDKFMSDILPKASSVEMLVENRHTSNFMSLIAPVYSEAPNILKWDNNFTWDYNGGAADSIKERVKAKGGNTEGFLRGSLSWYNYDDLDIRMVEPGGRVIYFGADSSPTSGKLDVDMNVNIQSRIAVENIVYTDKSKMKSGIYTLQVNNYRKRENIDTGFEVEFEYEGDVKVFCYDKPVKHKETVDVVKFKFTKTGGVEIIKSLPCDTISKEVWNIATQKWAKVDMSMLSPNHWDNNSAGNKHWFFILNGCKQEGKARGFYNEYLQESLKPLRKAFDTLSSKMMTEECDNTLSGVGFSSTQRNHAYFKVKGKFTRTIKVVF